jgi:hypothetical protein
MSVNFLIIESIETKEQFLAKPYFLEANSKYSLFCKYKDGKEPKFERWSLRNEYKENFNVIGNYSTSSIVFSWRNGIEYINNK